MPLFHMQPITNNFDLPKPADTATLSQDQSNNASGSLVNLPNGLSEEAIKKYAKTRNQTWDKWFTTQFKRIEANRKLWRNMQQGAIRSIGNAPIPLAIGYAIVESVAARLDTTLLQRPKFGEAVSDTVQPDNEAQSTVEDFVNQCVIAEARQPEKGKTCIKGTLLDGYVIARSLWDRKPIETEDAQYQADPINGQQVYTGSAPTTQFKEKWTFRKCNPANMAWDIHTTTKIQDSPWTRERDYKSFNELSEMQAAGEIQGIEALKNIVPSRLEGGAKEDFESKLKKAEGDPNWRLAYSDEKIYQIDEFFAYITYTQAADTETEEQTKTIKAHFFIVENDHVLMFEQNVFRPCRHPYVSAQAILDVDSVIGLAILEAIRPILDSINNYAGKQQALVEWCSNPIIFYGNKSGLAGRTTFTRPMGMQPVNDASDIKEFLANPDSVKVVLEYVQFLIDQARQASGANEQFQGTEGADTATEFQGLTAAAGSRFADISENLNQGLFECLMQECYWMYRQFGVDGQMVVHPQTEESAAVAINKQQLQGEYRFVASTTATDGYKGKQIQDDTQFLSMMDGVNQKGGINGMLYNMPKHITEISMPLRGQKSSKDMFVPAPQPPQMMLTDKGPIQVPPNGFVNLPGGNQGVPYGLGGVASVQGIGPMMPSQIQPGFETLGGVPHPGLQPAPSPPQMQPMGAPQ